MDPAATADITLDCRGRLCPTPVIEVAKAMRQLDTGQTVLLIADDPGADPDIHAWSEETGNELLEMTREGPVYRFLLRRAA